MQKKIPAGSITYHPRKNKNSFRAIEEQKLGTRKNNPEKEMLSKLLENSHIPGIGPFPLTPLGVSTAVPVIWLGAPKGWFVGRASYGRAIAGGPMPLGRAGLSLGKLKQIYV